MMADLRTALLGFDGKAVSYLSETGVRFRTHPSFLSDLVALANDPEAHIADGATWLVKDHLETGGAFPHELVEPLLRSVESRPSWGAILHVAQCVQHLDLSGVDDPSVFDAMYQHVSHDQPFVRAWALDAICRLSERVPVRRNQAREALNAALQDQAASVQARARRIAKDLSV
ncbi:MAG: hypothetical protein AAF996_16905 [Pseudomonadota bacterium]